MKEKKKTSRITKAVLAEEKEKLVKEKKKQAMEIARLQKELDQEIINLRERYLPQEMMKTSLLALGTVLCAIVWLRIACFSQTICPPAGSIIGCIIFGLIALAFTPDKKNDLSTPIIIGAVVGTLASVGIFNEWYQPIKYAVVIFLSIATILVLQFSGYNRKEDDFNFLPRIIMIVIFGIITIAGSIPLSKYNDMKQLKRDEKIAKILQINSGKEKTEIVLPTEHISNNKYLRHVFRVITNSDPNGIFWYKNSIFCKEGEKEWYKMPIDPNEREITLCFTHNWENYEKTVQIPAN